MTSNLLQRQPWRMFVAIHQERGNGNPAYRYWKKNLCVRELANGFVIIPVQKRRAEAGGKRDSGGYIFQIYASLLYHTHNIVLRINYSA